MSTKTKVKVDIVELFLILYILSISISCSSTSQSELSTQVQQFYNSIGSCVTRFVGFTDTSYTSYSRTGFEVLSLIEKLGTESSIQKLRMRIEKTEFNDYAALLLRMTVKPNGLRLKRFHYESDDSEKDRLALQLIQSFKDTLEYLNLKLHNPQHCTNFIEFPKMSRLISMSLSWFPENYTFERMNLNEIFPVLRELKLWKIAGQTNKTFFPDSAPCPNVNELQLHHTNGMTINAFNQRLAVFPNLTQLKIEIEVDGAEILKLIWSQMTRLKSLEICGYLQTMDSVDSILTGFSTPVLEELKDVFSVAGGMRTRVERKKMILKLRNQHYQQPSIRNLTSLSSLSLGLYFREGPETAMTELSAYFGFYSLERLKHLKLENCELTKTGCEILRNDMELEVWGFDNTAGENIITPRYEQC